MMMYNSWILWATGSALFAALTAILAKIGVENVSSDFAMFFRTSVVLIALFLLLLTTGQLALPENTSNRTYIFLTLSGFATGASWLCYFRALKAGNVAQVASIDKRSVVFVAVIAALFLGEKMTGVDWFGIVMIAMGAVLVAVK